MERKPNSEGGASESASEKEARLKLWLQRSHREIVATVVRRFIETAPSAIARKAVWEHEPGRWCLNRDQFHWRMTSTEPRSTRLKDFQLVIPRLNESQVFVGEGSSERMLDGDCASSLSLLHDLLALEWTVDEDMLASVVGESLFNRAECKWATVRWNRSGMEFHWRLPDWLSVEEYSLFVDYWMKARANVTSKSELAISDPESQHEYLLFAWLAGAINTLAFPLYDENKSNLVELPDRLPLPWKDLFVLLARVFRVAKKHENTWALSEFVRVVRDWATDLAMILAPEAGTPSEIARQFFEASEINAFAQGGPGEALWLTEPLFESVRRRRAEQCEEDGKRICDPYILGLISPFAAFSAISQLAGEQPARVPNPAPPGSSSNRFDSVHTPPSETQSSERPVREMLTNCRCMWEKSFGLPAEESGTGQPQNAVGAQDTNEAQNGMQSVKDALENLKSTLLNVAPLSERVRRAVEIADGLLLGASYVCYGRGGSPRHVLAVSWVLLKPCCCACGVVGARPESVGNLWSAPLRPWVLAQRRDGAVHRLSTRPTGLGPVRRTRPQIHRQSP